MAHLEETARGKKMKTPSLNMADIPANFFGPLFPTYDSPKMAEIFRIKKSDRVLDVGGGDNPFFMADRIVDTEFGSSPHRDGKGVPDDSGERYVRADVHALPFEDKSFDFVFCSHVLEHVSDPETACREIMRVGKRGYIETPRKWMEFFAGHPSHQWLIDDIDGVLVFERRNFIESPYLNCALHAAWRHKRLEELGLRHFRNISCVQYYWEDSFEFRVTGRTPGTFDYANPRHAALSHFFFARNILLMDAPPANGLYHIERSISLCPDVDIFWVLAAAYSLVLGNSRLWAQSSQILHEKGVLKKREVLMPRLGLGKKIMRKLMKIVEESPQISGVTP